MITINYKNKSITIETPRFPYQIGFYRLKTDYDLKFWTEHLKEKIWWNKPFEKEFKEIFRLINKNK